jgi:predicted outer membrane protein
MSKPVASLAIVTLFAGTVLAQGQSQQPAAGRQPGQGSDLDKQIAACLLLGNQEEVALAQFALDRCQDDQCKQFAETMIEHHQQAISKIEQAAPQLAAKDLKLRNAKLDRNENAQSSNQAGEQGNRLDPALMLTRQIKEECFALTAKALGEKQGAEFDKAYIGQQIMAHMLMKAELKGSEPFASEQLKPVIQEGMEVTEQHLARAKDIMEQLKGDSGQRQARAPE